MEKKLTATPGHIPVLLNEVMGLLNPQPGEFMIDGTANGGGHSKAILSKIGEKGKLLSVDWDEDLVKKLKKDFKDKKNIIVVNSNYADVEKILKTKKLPKADGLLLDLGFSSHQMNEGGRGFSFSEDRFLDMRYSKSEEIITAYEVVNGKSEQDLADIIFNYGEERFSRKIAKSIVEARRKKKIETARDLAEVIEKTLSRGYEKGRIHPATRTFQALRIYVNQELENLQKILNSLSDIMGPGARVVIISFHSLEDRIVKNHFKKLEKEKLGKILTKKPIIATNEELRINTRSRSAKLRGIQILTHNS